MATANKSANGRTVLDEESKAMLYKGLNLSELGVAFRMDHRVLTEKLTANGCQPSDTRNGFPTWKINDVAPYLVRPAYDIEAYIKRMNHADLPKQLTKEFWAGLKNKQDYELKAGQLWPTSKVIQEVGELMKLVKMQVLLMSDSVERSSELSDKQRAVLKEIADGMLADLHRMVIEKFSQSEEGNHGNDTDSEEL